MFNCMLCSTHVGFGMMGRHGNLFEDLMEYRVTCRMSVDTHHVWCALLCEVMSLLT